MKRNPNRAAWRKHPTWERKPNELHAKDDRGERHPYGPIGTLIDPPTASVSRDGRRYVRDPKTGAIRRAKRSGAAS